MKTSGFVLLVIIAVLGVLANVYAQTGARTLWANYYETVPALVPATDTDVYTSDVWLEQITLTNVTASSVTCSVLDKQATARALLKDVSIDGNSTFVISLTARYMPSGMSWSCSDAAAIVGYVRAKR